MKILLFSPKIASQTWYLPSFQWHCNWFVIAGLKWLIVCENYSLNLFNYRLSLVLWLIYCLWGIISESISNILPGIKKFNTHFTCCITCLVIGLINIYDPVFISIVCIGVSPPPQKHHSFIFVRTPIKSANSPNPFLVHFSLVFGFFVNPLPLKIRFFSKPSKY